MIDPPDPVLSLYGIRAGGPWIIVHGLRLVQFDHHSEWKYDLHWTGSGWSKPDADDAYVFEYEKNAQFHIDENRDELIRSIPRSFE
ncbi:hypothetical protein Enr13x_18760 [Stieleria neptunia]|uniref:Uncharacterized protein n=1 Tax=Stieleria neptunia TaxID=2527979 RepID=A0A518HME7_9BACT|nr:hypothetical protein Enr13x_18760 [Stieleria neptunia]